ncbi:PHP domain-containing protein [Nanoarchaeota archaeon]
MGVLFDLQTHSAISDGELTPTELIVYARECDLQIISITDHDTIDGYIEIISASKKYGMAVIPGIELSVEDVFEGKKVNNHLLVYGFNPEKLDSKLIEHFENDKIAKNNKSEKICKLSQQNPIELIDGSQIKPTFDQIKKFTKIDNVIHFGEIGAYIASRINKLHQKETGKNEIIIGMYEALGIFLKGEQKFIDQYSDILKNYVTSYIGDVGWHTEYNPELHSILHMDEALQYANEANGITIIAHPGEKGKMTRAKTVEEKLNSDERYLIEKKKKGLKGIEPYSPKHSPKKINYFLQFAVKHDLLIGAGSDYHGDNYSPDRELGHFSKRNSKNKMRFPFKGVKRLIEAIKD